MSPPLIPPYNSTQSILRPLNAFKACRLPVSFVNHRYRFRKFFIGNDGNSNSAKSRSSLTELQLFGLRVDVFTREALHCVQQLPVEHMYDCEWCRHSRRSNRTVQVYASHSAVVIHQTAVKPEVFRTSLTPLNHCGALRAS